MFSVVLFFLVSQEARAAGITVEGVQASLGLGRCGGVHRVVVKAQAWGALPSLARRYPRRHQKARKLCLFCRKAA